MVRLVKGAYWDTEIKRAQVDGLAGFPVFTRKVHTDVSYLACARKLLAAPDAVFPQFATHNAQTLATIQAMAGEKFHAGQYEFQCLHGMGEPLYEEVVGAGQAQPAVPHLRAGRHARDAARLPGAAAAGERRQHLVRQPHRRSTMTSTSWSPIRSSGARELRRSARRIRTSRCRATCSAARGEFGAGSISPASSGWRRWQRPCRQARRARRPCPCWPTGPRTAARATVRNPADRRDVVGQVIDATPEQVDAACAPCRRAAWQDAAGGARGDAARAADLLEAREPLLGLIVREAGKTAANAIAEVREAVDFLRYYARRRSRRFDNDTHRPLGLVVCISPWNFPLAIFTGQVAAALAAGNAVLAKPAEETPLIAAAGGALLHEAGVPGAALQLLPGAGEVGAALVADARGRAGDVHRLHRGRAARSAAARPAPRARQAADSADRRDRRAERDGRRFLGAARAGGGDVLASAFDSAGQRCSALRMLCLQEDIAERVLAMLKGAMAELAVGDPGPPRDRCRPGDHRRRRAAMSTHIEHARAGHAVHQAALPAAAAHGTFVPPTLIEIDRDRGLRARCSGRCCTWCATARGLGG